MAIIYSFVLTFICLYFVFQVGAIEKGIIKNIVTFILCMICIIPAILMNFEYIGILASSIIIILFDLFYDEKSFLKQFKILSVFYIVLVVIFLIYNLFNINRLNFLFIFLFLIMHIILSYYRKLIKEKYNIFIILMYLSYLYFSYINKGNFIILFLVICTFLCFETMLNSYNTRFKRKTSEFQMEVLANQYEEIKTAYLNMRGFRHDYHNHIQVLKAHLSMNKIYLAKRYLSEIEKEIEKIDSSVSSGNLMIDAILNSKISVAEKYTIKVTCKAAVPENIKISDIDLCIILGNLLDNAIESCEKIDENKFIRIYITKIKSQLYISIQNASKEILDFNEKNYITKKRGNHGLGIKRVKVLVDKYDGFLNLQNQPGVFASEVTIPI